MKRPQQIPAAIELNIVDAFPFLPVDELSALHAVAGDEVAKAAAVVTKTMAASCGVNRLAELHEYALQRLEPTVEPMTVAFSADNRTEADAYDDYFSIVRVKGNGRRIFARGTLHAFHDLFVDMRSGTELDPVGLNNVCAAEYELLRLVAPDEALYF